MKIYVAGSLDSKVQCQELSKQLVEFGHSVVSSWYEMHTGYDQSAKELALAAAKDFNEIKSCEVLIHAFTDVRSSGGGADSELGMAIALGKTVLVLGPRVNVFHNLCQCFNDEEALFKVIEVIKQVITVVSMEQGESKVLIRFSNDEERRMNWFDAINKYPVGSAHLVLPEED